MSDLIYVVSRVVGTFIGHKVVRGKSASLIHSQTVVRRTSLEWNFFGTVLIKVCDYQLDGSYWAKKLEQRKLLIGTIASLHI